MRTFAARLATLAALVSFVLVAVLAVGGFMFVTTIRIGNEALSTYSEELMFAWRLQEAHERKLAAGRGYLLAHDEALTGELDRASNDIDELLAQLHERVKSPEGIALLDETTRTVRVHDAALRALLGMNAGPGEIAQRWLTTVLPKATQARASMDAFIHHKEKLH